MNSQGHKKSERKQTDEKIYNSEEKYRLMVENANEGIVVAQDGMIVYANPNVMEVSGYSFNELRSKLFVQFVHPDDREMVLKYHIERLKGEEVASVYQFRIIDKNENIKWIEGSVVLINWDGKSASLILLKDINDRKNAENALKRSEEKYSTLVEKGNDGIVILQDGLVKFLNSKISEITGFLVEEGLEKPFIDFVSPEYRKLLMERYKRRITGEKIPNRYEAELLSKEGKKIPVEINASKIEYEGRPADMAIIRDITDRKRMEISLIDSEKRYRSLFEDSRDAIYISTRAGKFVEVNQSMLELFGYTREELLTLDILKLYFDPEERKIFQQEIEQKGSVRDYELRFRKKDGTKIACLLNSTVRKADDGSILGYQGIIRNITEQKLAESALQTSKALYKTLASLLLMQNKNKHTKSIIDLKNGFKEIRDTP
jgi:PAS domain S-box-containing protein